MAFPRHYGDTSVELSSDGVALVEIHRPPNNHFDVALISSLADAYEALDADSSCRAIVLAAEGKHFCAGAQFAPSQSAGDSGGGPGFGDGNLYFEAGRLVDAKKPVVAAVHGAAIGGGLGLACSADFRVGCLETRMAANFSQLGFHHGFGLTALLPPIVGQQRALELLMTGRRVNGEYAYGIGLLDRFVPRDQVRDEALRLAGEIASAAPLAVVSIRATMRDGLSERYRAATAREAFEQECLRTSDDFVEGIRASAERRPPNFRGQ